MIDPKDLPMKKVETPEITDSLRAILDRGVENINQALAEIPQPKGRCSIHGNVGHARMICFDPSAENDSDKIISEHCMHCLSRVFTALVGVLEDE